MLDTVITITIYDGDPDALNGAITLCKNYENLLSKTVQSSDVYKINHSNDTPTDVSPDTAELLKTALDIAKTSNGAFDPTILPLVEIWDVRNRTAPPSETEIKDSLDYVNHRNVIINGTAVTVKENAKIDLGGIAKGFIADKVKQYLMSKGVTSAVINLGGNTLLIGSKQGQNFSVGLQKPFGKNGELSAVLNLTDKTVVTSGIYQRYFKFDNKIYHHIIDPKTGYPCDNEITSVTVITDSSTVADGLSTACLNLGIDKGIKLAKQYNAELIFIDTNGNLILTDGLTQTIIDGQPHITLK
jgi:thiamine biosynthesis lipoprotein